MLTHTNHIIQAYHNFISNKAFPCTGAKTAMAKQQAKVFVAGHMACPSHDKAIVDFLYQFVDHYRTENSNFHSAAILFTGPEQTDETGFEKMMWSRLQAITDIDSAQYPWDARVSPDPQSPEFSFSIKSEAFFIIGMHPGSSRAARQFSYPALVFNPHAQFTAMKESNKYSMMQQSIRKRDVAFSGSVNPMLSDHGRAPETVQYSGRHYTQPMQCPLNIKHVTT